MAAPDDGAKNLADEGPSDAADVRARCPFCGSHDVEELSPFASQLSTSQYVCRACRTPFEVFGREPFEDC